VLDGRFVAARGDQRLNLQIALARCWSARLESLAEALWVKY
jgi:hypothetical protein